MKANLATEHVRSPHPQERSEQMLWLSGGSFQMGSNLHYPEEAPAHQTQVQGFWIDVTPVTNLEFAAFVAETGYVTLAEQVPNAADYPGAKPEMLYAGSMVFTPPLHPVYLGDASQWWDFRRAADWRHPEGRYSNIRRMGDHPVVHVAYCDALAYAHWAGKDLPTEAEWEYAARGNLVAAEYAWGDEFTPAKRQMANTWQGNFPSQNLEEDGFARTSPVHAFPPNGFGLFDMIGNVWEWTSDWYATSHSVAEADSCCSGSGAEDKRMEGSFDPRQSVRIPRRVVKGGSHLCAPNYCRRYRPAARHPQAIDSSASHVGFRCVLRTSAGGTKP
jgi:sulfatase modifying factor 1